MRTAIVYYSFTGTTRALAGMLAAPLGAELAEIGCGRYGAGGLSFFRAAVDSVLGLLPEVAPLPQLAGVERLLIGAPVWVGRPATPVRAWLRARPPLPARVGLFVTASGEGTGRALEELRRLAGRPGAPGLAATEAETGAGRLPGGADAFLAALG